MISSNDLNTLLQQMMSQVGQGPFLSAKKNRSIINGCDKNANGKNTLLSHITPDRILVIAGLLTGTLEVQEVSVDRDQVVQISLAGSLKRKTKLDKMLDEIGQMPFDEVLKAVLKRS